MTLNHFSHQQNHIIFIHDLVYELSHTKSQKLQDTK